LRCAKISAIYIPIEAAIPPPGVSKMLHSVPTYTLSIEPVNGTAYQHPYHLGTIESVARQVAADVFYAPKMRTVALIFKGKIVDVFYGDKWHSEIIEAEE
jgi:hypothetical protein